MRMSGVVRHGGCLCGSVRYTVQWPPLATVVCHCKNCQKQAGSAFSVVAVLRRDSLSLEGALTTYQDQGASGQPVYRKFCGRCGSPVVTDTPAAEGQGIIFVKAGTLDGAADLQPTRHYWCDSAQQWFDFPAGVERLAQQ
jgi:hypothetical protein